MRELKLGAAPGLVDRLHGILSGAVAVPGVSLRIEEPPSRDELFARLASADDGIDLAEMSLATYLLQLSMGDDRLAALPVFTSRAYRHGQIFVAADRPAGDPAELAGSRIGMPYYEMTAAVWARAHLQEEAGIDPRAPAWRVGGFSRPGYRPRLRYSWPDGFDIDRIDESLTLEQALVRGHLDALIAPGLPGGFAADPPTVRRLFLDYRERAEAYAARTGRFPIMHVLVLRREVLRAEPWLGPRLVEAFEESRRQARAALADPDTPAVMLPWAGEELDRFERMLGREAYHNGVEANREEIEVFLRHLAEQGLLRSPVTVREAFPAPEEQ